MTGEGWAGVLRGRRQKVSWKSPLGEEGTDVIVSPPSWVVPTVIMISVLHAESKEFTLCGNKPTQTVQGQSWGLMQVCGALTLQAPTPKKAG